MMDEPTRLQFGPPQYKVVAFPIEKKPQKVAIQMPSGSQLMRAEIPDYNTEHIFLWAMVPVKPDEEKGLLTYDIIVTYAGVPFGIEEQVCPMELADGSIIESTYAHVHHLGMWTERKVDADGTVRYVAGHVLEVVEDRDDDDGCGEAPPEETPSTG